MYWLVKVVGVAFELHDTWIISNKLKSGKRNSYIPEETSNLMLKYKGIVTTPYDMISYFFCYIGMMTGKFTEFCAWYTYMYIPRGFCVVLNCELYAGPYYTYRAFDDMLIGWPSRAPALSGSPFLRRLQEAPFFGVAYLISSYFVSVDVSYFLFDASQVNTNFGNLHLVLYRHLQHSILN